MRARVVAVVFVLVVSGCGAPTAVPEADVGADRDPGTIGEFSANDSLEIDDGALSRADLEAVKYRSMARIELIRDEQFTEDVELEVITRAEYRERTDRAAEPADPFTNELWRAAFVVDGDTDVNEAFDELYGDAVVGYYTSGRIVVVTDGEGTRIDRDTLVHELVHALQDQRGRLDREGTALDERRAEAGLFEGEANYVPVLYDDRCEREWECLPARTPADGASGAELEARPFNAGLFLSVYAPYAEGLAFVEHRHETGGWAAVDDAFRDRPTGTAQLIHPERYPDEPAVAVGLADRSSDRWEPVTDEEGEVRTETVGEATLFSSLWANGAIDRSLTDGARGNSPYNYSHPATDGWAGDTFVAYETDDGGLGHVWALEWRSDEDAEAFAAAYERVLEERGDEAITGESGVFRIGDEEPFAGAYRVAVEDDRVEIVGAPTVGELEEIRPGEVTPAVELATPPTGATPETAAPPTAGRPTAADGSVTG